MNFSEITKIFHINHFFYILFFKKQKKQFILPGFLEQTRKYMKLTTADSGASGNMPSDKNRWRIHWCLYQQ